MRKGRNSHHIFVGLPKSLWTLLLRGIEAEVFKLKEEIIDRQPGKLVTTSLQGGCAGISWSSHTCSIHPPYIAPKPFLCLFHVTMQACLNLYHFKIRFSLSLQLSPSVRPSFNFWTLPAYSEPGVCPLLFHFSVTPLWNMNKSCSCKFCLQNFPKTGPFLSTHILKIVVWPVIVPHPHPLPWLNKSNLTLIRSCHCEDLFLSLLLWPCHLYVPLLVPSSVLPQTHAASFPFPFPDP